MMRGPAAIVLAALVWSNTVSWTIGKVLDEFEDDQVLNNLGIPTDFTWTPEGQLLTTNKGGQLFVHDDPDGDNSYSSQTTGLNISDIICDNGERGVQGVAVHPDFITNRYIYLYYTFNKNGNCDEDPFIGPVNRLSRFILPTSNVIDITSEEVFFETPSLEYDHHNSGDISFGKDGYVYVSIGDGGATFSAVSQNLGNFFGTILRITADNEIPSTNPYTFESGEFNSIRCNLNGVPPPGSPEGAKCQEIFAYGLRNPFRFSFDPNTEGDKVRFYINDVGQSKWEEIDEGGDDFAGANYGWPVREGPCPTNKLEECDDEHPYTDPVHYWVHKKRGGGAITGGAFVPDGLWPKEFDGSYIYAEYVFDQLNLLRPGSIDDECRSCDPPDANRKVDRLTKYERIITVAFGPFGDTLALYYVAADGSMHRVTYVGDGNRAPEAVMLADPTSGPVGVTVQFSAAGSSDFDGDTLKFQWDFDGDGEIDSTEATDSASYAKSGVYLATLTVRDGNGGKRIKTIEISVGNKPVAVIKSPPEGATFGVGEVMNLTGSATDEENGELADTSLVWEVRQHHNTHYHPFLDLRTGNNIVLQPAPGPEDYKAATNSYLEIILTATDADGLSNTVTRNVQPRKVLLDLDTDPSGLDVVLDGSPFTTPGSATTWEGHILRIEAPNQGNTESSYIFDSWSDGGNQVHQVSIPPAPDVLPSFVAVFTELVGTFTPTAAPSEAPVCLPFALLETGQDIIQGNASISEEAGVYLLQQDDGILAVIRGTPSDPGKIVWQSTETPGPTGEYYSKIQGDSNMLTRFGTPENRISTFWKSESTQAINGDHFFAMNCDLVTLSIYQGTPKNPGEIVWNTVPTPPPTIAPISAPVIITMVPSLPPATTVPSTVVSTPAPAIAPISAPVIVTMVPSLPPMTTAVPSTVISTPAPAIAPTSAPVVVAMVPSLPPVTIVPSTVISTPPAIAPTSAPVVVAMVPSLTPATDVPSTAPVLAPISLPGAPVATIPSTILTPKPIAVPTANEPASSGFMLNSFGLGLAFASMTLMTLL